MRYLFLLLILFCSSEIQATHNRAGEIRVEQLGPLTVRATIITYTKASSVDADRDSIRIDWGDGSSEVVARSNGGGQGVNIGNNVKINLYIATHNYPGFNLYTISMEDPNRNGGILNVNAPNSINVPFYIETQISLISSQFQGFNSTAVLTQAPIDFGCVGQIFEHNPGAFDTDGDSLAYELVIPKQSVNQNVPNYRFPNEILMDNNTINFNEKTGDFIWIFPQLAGEYNIAILVKEFRNGQLIAQTVRDMQIFIDNCNNTPPILEVIDEICVVAGEKLVISVTGNDLDIGQQVLLEANGGVFFVENPASFEAPSNFVEPIIRGTLTWNTTCNHIREQPYEVIFKATDNFVGDAGLSDLKRVTIKVVGPPPIEIEASSQASGIQISWGKPYTCEITDDDYFRGFSIWRRPSGNSFIVDTCSPGLEGRGYTRIARNENTFEGNRYTYLDENVDQATSYCYRILADFALLSQGGNPFNSVSSLASEEICEIHNFNTPILNKVSVLETDETQGRMDIRWIFPPEENIDTSLFPGPYRLELYTTTKLRPTIEDFELIPDAIFSAESLSEWTDTIYIHNDINTKELSHSYALFFFAADSENSFGISPTASSIFLNVLSSDRRNVLDIDINVPWTNILYTIFLENPDGSFEFLAETSDTVYTHFGLENGREYCYFIESQGNYGISRIPNILLNNSQENCGIPIDTSPPCPARLDVTNVCENPDINPEQFLTNFLEWNYMFNENCPSDDPQSILIWYRAPGDENFQFIDRIDNIIINSFQHILSDNLAGCYAISLLDSEGNESELSNIQCVDNCPEYRLPNVFSPNNDGTNDLFQPFPYRFIERTDIQIFNRWGQLVFETTNPDINWDGKNLAGNELAEGVYYYKARIFEQRVDGIVESSEILSGFVHLLR